ncbi:GTP-binding protein Rho1 [Sorochytrium milnesiophthora]
MAEIRRKLVIVGDGACGKTCLLIVFSKGTFPVRYVPTVFENYVADVEVDGKHVELALWDTAGQEDYDRLRPLSYPDSHVILICFAIDSPDSLENVREKWMSEVLHFCAGLPILLIGCKKDLRNDANTVATLARNNQKPVTPEEGAAVADRIGAKFYLECSAMLNEGVREVFEHATRAALVTSQHMDFSEGIFKQSRSLCFFDADDSLIATCVANKIVVRDANTLQITHVFSAVDNIQHIAFSPDSSASAASTTTSREPCILAAVYELGVVQVWRLHAQPTATTASGRTKSGVAASAAGGLAGAGPTPPADSASPMNPFMPRQQQQQTPSPPTSASARRASNLQQQQQQQQRTGKFTTPTPGSAAATDSPPGWDNACVAKIDEGVAGCVRADWAPCGTRVLTWTDFGLRLTVWSLVDGSAVVVQSPKFPDRGLAYRRDDRYVAVAERHDVKDYVSVYDTETWTLVQRFQTETNDLADLAWSPCGTFIAVWDTNLEFKMLWSPSSQFLAIGSFDQKLRLLNHYTFNALITWSHGSSVTLSKRQNAVLFREADMAFAPTTSMTKNWPKMSTIGRPRLRYEALAPPESGSQSYPLPTIKPDYEKPNVRVGISLVSFSPDARYLVAKNDITPNVLYVYSVAGLRLVSVLQQSEAVRQCTWIPGKPNTLSFCTGNSHLYFWDGSRSVRSKAARNATEEQDFAEDDDAADSDDQELADVRHKDSEGVAESVEIPSAGGDPANDVIIDDFTNGITTNLLGLPNTVSDVASWDPAKHAMMFNTAWKPGGNDGWAVTMIGTHGMCFDLRGYDLSFTMQGTINATFSVELQTNWQGCIDDRYTTRYRIPFTITSCDRQTIQFPITQFDAVRRDLPNGYAIGIVDLTPNSLYELDNIKLVKRRRWCCASEHSCYHLRGGANEEEEEEE